MRIPPATLASVVVATAVLLGAVAALGGGVGSAPGAAAAPPTKQTQAQTIAEAWERLPETGSACGDDLIFDYGKDGGMRNFFCRALTVFSWKTFLAMAPSPVFLKGPHKNGRLSLRAERDFGRYNPAFVRWAATALVPAATDEALRKRTQPIYDAQVKELARVYALVDRALSSDPAWVEAERVRYLGGIDAKGGAWNVFEVTGHYHDVLGDAAADWGGHDPNHVRSAVMWWLRRHHDGTAALWREGLARLLSTYDASWWNETKARPFSGRLPRPPQEPATPEYR